MSATPSMRLRHRDRRVYLFPSGQDPGSINLGDMVVQDSASPTMPTHFSHQPLSQDKSIIYTTKDRLKSCLFRSGHGGYNGQDHVNLDAAESIDIDLSWSRSCQKVVAAMEGTCISLRREHADAFVHDEIFRNESAIQFLAPATLIPDLNYYATLKWMTKPKVYMVTSVYMLRDAMIYQMFNEYHNKEGTSELELDPLMNVPVGGVIQVGEKARMKAVEKWKGALVWAVEYTRLDLKFVRDGKRHGWWEVQDTVGRSPRSRGKEDFEDDDLFEKVGCKASCI